MLLMTHAKHKWALLDAASIQSFATPCSLLASATVFRSSDGDLSLAFGLTRYYVSRVLESGQDTRLLCAPVGLHELQQCGLICPNSS